MRQLLLGHVRRAHRHAGKGEQRVQTDLIMGEHLVHTDHFGYPAGPGWVLTFSVLIYWVLTCLLLAYKMIVLLKYFLLTCWVLVCWVLTSVVLTFPVLT